MKLRIKPLLLAIGSFVFSLFLSRMLLVPFVFAQTPTGAQMLLSSNKSSVVPGDTVSINLGFDSQDNTIVALDAVLIFDSNLLQVESVTLGKTYLQTLAPQTENVFDLQKALFINNDNPSQSRLELGFLAFDSINQQLISPQKGLFDPQTQPIASIVFKAKAVGQAKIGFQFDGTGTTLDSNLVTNDLGDPQDILQSVSSDLLLNIVNLTSPSPSLQPKTCDQIDFNQNQSIDISDIMQISSRWNSRAGDAYYDALYDLDQNQQINIIDIQTISSRWLENCPK